MFNCGTDLEQTVNGVISYIPHLTKQSLQSDVFVKYFDGEEKVCSLCTTSKTS